MNKTLVIAVVALVLSAGALLFPNTTERVVETVTLGSGSGQNHSFTEFFDQSLVNGGGCFATSTTQTLSASTLEKNSCITILATGAGQGTISLTLPATTSMSGVLGRNQGACRSWFIDNTDTAAATTTTIVKGTGWDLMGLDATGAGTGADVIDGLESAVLTACRQRDGDIIGQVYEYIHAD